MGTCTINLQIKFAVEIWKQVINNSSHQVGTLWFSGSQIHQMGHGFLARGTFFFPSQPFCAAVTLKDETFKTLYSSDSQPLPRRSTPQLLNNKGCLSTWDVQVHGRKSLLETSTWACTRSPSWRQPYPKPDKLDLCTLLSPTSMFGQVTARTHNRLTRIGVRQHCPHGFNFLSKSLSLVLRKKRAMLGVLVATEKTYEGYSPEWKDRHGISKAELCTRKKR